MPRTNFGRDLRGNYRRRIGWSLVGGERKPHQFYFGKDEVVARERAELLKAVWAGVERVWGETAYHRQSISQRPIWDEATLAIALAVAGGYPDAFIVLPQWLRDYLARADEFEELDKRRDGSVASESPQRTTPLLTGRERDDDIILEYVASLRKHIPRPTIHLAEPDFEGWEKYHRKLEPATAEGKRCQPTRKAGVPNKRAVDDRLISEKSDTIKQRRSDGSDATKSLSGHFEGRAVANTTTKDARGNYRRDLGWKSNKSRLHQHRFYLGQDEAEAEARSELLQYVWEAVERMWRRWDYGGTPSRPLWDDTTLEIALAVARGEKKVAVDAPPWIPEYAARILEPREVKPGLRRTVYPCWRGIPGTSDFLDSVLASYFAELRIQLPFLVIAANDPEPERRAMARLQSDSCKNRLGGRSQAAQSFGLEFSLAYGDPTTDLEFTERGVCLKWGSTTTSVPWAMVGGALALILRFQHRHHWREERLASSSAAPVATSIPGPPMAPIICADPKAPGNVAPNSEERRLRRDGPTSKPAQPS